MELCGATKAALNRLTSELGGDLYGNVVGPRVAVKSEGLAAVIGNELPAELFDSQEEIAEAVVALCDCSSDVTGRVVASLDLLAEWNLTVHRLDGAIA
jgi:citronellol/citronellal dehydrogenase